METAFGRRNVTLRGVERKRIALKLSDGNNTSFAQLPRPVEIPAGFRLR